MLVRLLVDRRRLARRDRWTRGELDAHQAAALRELRAFAVERSPFYRRFHAGMEARRLEELPVLMKHELMESFDELVTDRAVRLADVRAHLAGDAAGERFRDRYWVAATAGSTGAPGVFLHDDREWRAVLASYARANDWAHIEAGLTHRLKLAVVSSRTPWHQSAIVGRTLESRFVRALRIDATEPLEDILVQLNAFQPDSLVGYASMLRLLANEQIEGRLRIQPKGIMSASEVLTTESRARMRRAWSREAFDVYAATEPAGIASECDRHAGLHLYEDLVITEVVDDANRPVPVGRVGAKVLVTVLFRRTQPLIRYEMSDCIALMPGACACGRPFARVAHVEGREEEILSLPRVRDDGRTAVHPNVFHRILELVAVGAWQVVHERDDVLRVILAGARPELDERRLADDLVRALAASGARAAAIVVDRVASIPRTPIGKAPLIRRVA